MLDDSDEQLGAAGHWLAASCVATGFISMDATAFHSQWLCPGSTNGLTGLGEIESQPRFSPELKQYTTQHSQPWVCIHKKSGPWRDMCVHCSCNATRTHQDSYSPRPLTEGRIKTWCVHTTEEHPAALKDEMLPPATTWWTWGFYHTK